MVAAAAAAFMYFTHLIGSTTTEQSAASSLAPTAGMLTGIFMVVAALALFTAPLSISLGEFFDED